MCYGDWGLFVQLWKTQIFTGDGGLSLKLDENIVVWYLILKAKVWKRINHS